jgi:hypothetical protein
MTNYTAKWLLPILCLAAAALWPTFAPAADPGTAIPIPEALAGSALDRPASPMEIADAFLRIPYRIDGTLDEEGRFALFADPKRTFETPGLNCSGLILSIARFLVHKNITVEESRRDRLGDSGPEAPQGENWDFGWDLVLNLTEGLERRVVMPDGTEPDLAGGSGETLVGFDLQDQAAWDKVLDRIKPGRLYPASFSRPSGKAEAQHWHVGLMLADKQGGVWMYQTTRTSGGAYRANLRSAEGMSRFRKAYPHSWRGKKRILIIETPLPGTE